MPEPAFQGQVAKRLPGILVPLALLAVFIIALGLVQAGRYVTEMFVQLVKKTVGRIPLIGGTIARPAEALGKIIVTYMGRAAATCERKVAAYFRDVATVLVDLAAEITGEAVALAALVWWLVNKVGVHKLPYRQRIAERKANAISAEQKRQQKLIAQINRALDKNPTQKPIIVTTPAPPTIVRQTVTINKTFIQAAALTIPTFPKMLPRWVHAMRRKLPQLQRGQLTLRKRVTHIERRFTNRRFDGMVARAMNRLGIGWTRCTTVQRLGRELCRSGPGWLNPLLLNLVPLLLITDLCAVFKAGRVLANLSEPVVMELVHVAGAADLCSGLQGPGELHVARAALAQSDPLLALV